MSPTAVPIYFELSWSILSSIGLINVLFGLLVAGITSFSPISIVPIVVSAACAVANGMCYYAFYADYPQIPVVVAGAFADIMWLVSVICKPGPALPLTSGPDPRGRNVLLQLSDPKACPKRKRSDCVLYYLLDLNDRDFNYQNRHLGQPGAG